MTELCCNIGFFWSEHIDIFSKNFLINENYDIPWPQNYERTWIEGGNQEKGLFLREQYLFY